MATAREDSSRVTVPCLKFCLHQRGTMISSRNSNMVLSEMQEWVASGDSSTIMGATARSSSPRVPTYCCCVVETWSATQPCCTHATVKHTKATMRIKVAATKLAFWLAAEPTVAAAQLHRNTTGRAATGFATLYSSSRIGSRNDNSIASCSYSASGCVSTRVDDARSASARSGSSVPSSPPLMIVFQSGCEPVCSSPVDSVPGGYVSDPTGDGKITGP
mmetsp:Transcript_13472/g.30983  ORF Transcript_13472/g.30983 Transcript_13472/m.30983 type:complete len:218 (+) Transcript_13472:1201-1854(+)